MFEPQDWDRVKMSLEFNRGGLISVDKVIDEILVPMQLALRMAQRMRTLKEAVDLSGRSAGFFRDQQATLGGRSRLQVWEDKGLARLTKAGWLINEAVIPQKAEGRTVGPRAGGEPDVDEIERRLDAKMGHSSEE